MVTSVAPPLGIGTNPEALAKYTQAIDAQLAALENRSGNIPWFKISAALADPGRTGSAAEGFGRAMGVIGQQQEEEQKNALPIAQMRAQLAGQKFQMSQQAKAMEGLQAMTGGVPQMIAAADLPTIAKTLNLEIDDPKLTQLVGQPKAPFMTSTGQSVIGATAQPMFSKEEVNQALIASGGDPSGAMKMLFERQTKWNEPGTMQKDIAYAMNPNTPPYARQLALQRITMDAQRLGLDVERLFVESGYRYSGAPITGSGFGPPRPEPLPPGVVPGVDEARKPKTDEEIEDQRGKGDTPRAGSTPAGSVALPSGWRKEGNVYYAPDGVPLDLTEVKSPKMQQELIVDAQKKYGDRSSVGFTERAKAQAGEDVKEMVNIRNTAKTASNVVNLADNQISIIKNNPVVFGYLNDASASSAIFRAIKSASVANANLTVDEIARYLKGSVKPQDLDTVAMFVNNATQLNLNFAQISYKNQGAVTENERSYINTLAGSPSESTTVLRLKAQAYKVSAQRDMDVHDAYLKFEQDNPRQTHNDFLRSNIFKEIKTKYEDKFKEMRRESEQLLKVPTVAPRSPTGGGNLQRLRDATGG